MNRSLDTTSNEQPVSGEQASELTHVQCCIVGCGPAGALLGLLLARRGIDVLVLEKHNDFLRDFRGDNIHPSTMRIMDELGLADRLLQLPHSKVPQLLIRTPQGVRAMADFSHLKTRWPYIVFLPQWDFLDFITGEARRYPNFHLLMNAEGQDLIKENGVVCGVQYSMPDGQHQVHAPLVVAADGRSSLIRAQTTLAQVNTAPPMDILWFRLSQHENDPQDSVFSISEGHVVGMINRRSYWQIAYIIPKGNDQQIRAAGLQQFRRSVQELVPLFADRVDELQDWDQVKLLVVQANRLKRWYQPGLLCIGDAAHAMSPIGGVGINLALQDAVVAANILTQPLKTGHLHTRYLAAIQRRRQWPTLIIQTLQALLQKRVGAPILRSSRPTQMPPFLETLLRLTGIRNLPARLIGFGVWPVHIRN